MKLLHYFLAFNAFALAFWEFTAVLMDPEILVGYYIANCLIFSLLSAIGVYNLKEGLKKQNSDWY